MPDEFRSIDACGTLRQSCRDAIFSKMGEQHRETIGKLGEIREALAKNEGREEARKESTRSTAESSFWANPVTVSVVSAIITAALMGGLAAYFLHGGK